MDNSASSLLFQNFPVNLQTSAKYHDLKFDHKISLTLHNKILKAQYLNSINILEYLSHPRTAPIVNYPPPPTHTRA